MKMRIRDIKTKAVPKKMSTTRSRVRRYKIALWISLFLNSSAACYIYLTT